MRSTPRPPGSTLLVEGTCLGNFYIINNVTLSGPATLDGGGVATTYGATLNVISGTVVLNNLVIEDGVGIDGLGGGLWNGGQLTLNHTSVSHNNAFGAGGVFNMGQLVLNRFECVEQLRHAVATAAHLRTAAPACRPTASAPVRPPP